MQKAENEGRTLSAFCILPSACGRSTMKPIPHVQRVKATVTAPPSKSYSVRALLLGAMSAEATTITNCLDADDTRYGLEALRTIGFQVSGNFKEGVTIGERLSMSAN